jgi:hypothetical protein
VNPMSPSVGAGITLGMLLLIYRILLRPRGRWTAFNPARARTRARAGSSANGLLVLAAVNVAVLGWDIAVQGALLHVRALTDALSVLIPVLIVTILVLLVVSRSLADMVIGLIGSGAAFVSAYLQGGLAAVIAVLVLTMLAMFILGVARGFLRPL